jgi:hypothetical protein
VSDEDDYDAPVDDLDDDLSIEIEPDEKETDPRWDELRNIDN